MKFKHYITQELDPRLEADIATRKKGATLYVRVIGVGRYKITQPIFARECKTEAEAVEIMKGFGHGFEYMGVRWCETVGCDLVPIE